MNTWLLYGAYGYTGQLIGEEAKRRGLSIIAAGRDAERLAEVENKWSVPGRVVALQDETALRDVLNEVDGVMHCAGPFEDTAHPMLHACLDTGTHYLDITGEWQVFEALRRRKADIQKAGIVVLPGVGFDVVPTDCVAATLAQACPDATALSLGFVGLGALSRGTALTALRGWGRGSLMRRNGQLVRIPAGTHTREVDIAGRMRTLTAIPWGDVSTAYHSTGIPTITVYTHVPPALQWMLRASGSLPAWLRAVLRPVVEGVVRRTVDGPDAEMRKTGASWVWGQVQRPDGSTRTARWTGPEGYTLTARTAVEAMHRMEDARPDPGYHTPSTAFGASFVETVAESSAVQLEPAP
ncbi:saccharopine dehydrogenase [Longimonas halophila]|uniref:Saccharopine dehydrogenase n=1 Tax=Longimonas halophila TaxID=1469170 RepID=A0A2H3NX56_9BACT|nr:saccharopine dehydrogenase NADP-binding domain-containing protein [Longimonas halophila]PEN06707.1 saccharopine dehydrogenase [Longimonas halophila]